MKASRRVKGLGAGVSSVGTGGNVFGSVGPESR
jgi:hypothetical protein